MTATPSPATSVPGPRAPVLGWRGQAIRFLHDPITFMQALYREHGRLAAWVAGNPMWMFAFGPAYNQLVLADPARFYNTPIAPLATPPNTALSRLTHNLLSMNGDVHRRQRRLVLPAFHKKRVEGYRDEMVAIAERELAGWRVGQRRDIAREMQRLTLCIASGTLFGVDASAEAGSVGSVIHSWMGLLESGGVFLLPKDLPGTPMRRLLRTSDRLEARIQAIIDHKRASGDAGDAATGGMGRDVLAMLIEARDESGAAMTDAELIGQTSVLFVAGHETSSNALTWTLFLLSQHPRILADLVDELHGALHGAAPTVEQLGRLPLLDRVLKESLRLLPPAPFQMRYGTAPFQLGPHMAPAGATVTLSAYMTHRLPEIYLQPLSFDPARWETLDPTVYEYMPFGAGPHMCIGSTFAIMEVKLVLAMIVQRFRLQLAPGARIDRRVTITMSPRHGMPMAIVPNDRAVKPGGVRGNIHQMVALR
jgi:cytochrome P450